MSVTRALEFLDALELTEVEQLIGARIVKEIRERLTFLDNVGVGYLKLDRAAATLSGGEAQRLRLATQIGSQLVGVLYILDEPSIGLHQRDNGKLIGTLERLRDLGNTVVVVEHDEQMMRSADWLVDMGPGAGEHGGHVVAEGTAAKVERNPTSVTGQFLSGKREIAVPERRDRGSRLVRGARRVAAQPEGDRRRVPGRQVRLRHGRVRLGQVDARQRDRLQGAREPAAPDARRSRASTSRSRGSTCFDKVIDIDQSPIGRTPRSNPATYTELFDADPRALLADARGEGARLQAGPLLVQRPRRALRDVQGRRARSRSRCTSCPTSTCRARPVKGARYNRETLEVRFKGKKIAEVLDMSVEEALAFFAKIPKIRRQLQTLHDVGLDYIKLGQPATTLSGGEAQRVKLASELSKVATGRTLYILDEPTTGLHFADIEKLLEVLQRLVDAGNTVLVIEHNLDVIKQADWIIDLGPEGGEAAGEVIATGTPEQVAEVEGSATADISARFSRRRWRGGSSGSRLAKRSSA